MAYFILMKNIIPFPRFPGLRIFLSSILLLTVLSLAISCVDLDAIVISNPDLSKSKDGSYEGNSKVGPVRVTLRISVNDAQITSIELIKHFNGRGKKAEEIIPLIIEKQSLEVDIISGATASSKAILKAAEDALAKSR